MPARRGSRAVLAASLLLLARAQPSSLTAVDEFAADDECLAGDSGCALNALQRKHAKSLAADGLAGLDPSGANASAQSSDGKPFKEDCQDCMQNNFEPSAQILGASPIHHYALDCWRPCGGAGACSWCGEGNACCRYRARSDPAECKGVVFWPVLSYHTCVQPVHKAPPRPEGPTLSPPGAASGYFPQVQALAAPSQAPVLSFYMYRALGDDDYPPENVNAANLAGVMWYLHNEVVVQTPRKFGITRIMRMKVQTKAPQPLLDQGMNFGARYAFDGGACTGPWDCSQQFAKYGYFVGCNMAGNFPTDKWRQENHYPNAVWYSLPGPCSSRRYDSHSDACTMVEPGGACSGTPTGRGNCTYSYMPAGEISIDELEGIEDYQAFIKAGNHEYINQMDKGVGMSFWDGKASAAKCQARVDAAERLFALKYGEPEPLDTPKCDFDYHSFYAGGR